MVICCRIPPLCSLNCSAATISTLNKDENYPYETSPTSSRSMYILPTWPLIDLVVSLVVLLPMRYSKNVLGYSLIFPQESNFVPLFCLPNYFLCTAIHTLFLKTFADFHLPFPTPKIQCPSHPGFLKFGDHIMFKFLLFIYKWLVLFMCKLTDKYKVLR